MTEVVATTGLICAAVFIAAHGPVANAIREAVESLVPRRRISTRRLPRRLLACVDRTLSVGVSGRILLPSDIVIRVNSADIEPFRDALARLEADLEEGVVKRAASAGWDLSARPNVRVDIDDSRPVGAPRATGKFAEETRPFQTQQSPAGETVPIDGAKTLPGVLIELLDARQAVTSAVLFEGAKLIVGRSGEADLTTLAPTVSRRHAKLTLASGLLEIADLRSSNGTRVNGRRVDRSALANGDNVQFGQATYTVCVLDHRR